MKKQNKEKGFTIIELIIVMAILALFVLIAVPKFIGHTKEARLTKIKASAKEIESASDRYYLKSSDWPRATDKDDFYTKEELDTYAKEIYDKTGTIINLEETGHYYDIDYVALKNYIRVPDESVKYIIQNPVGRVYYLDKLTPEGEQIFNDKKDDTQVVTPKPIPEPELEPSDEGWFIIDEIGNVSASNILKAFPGPIDIVIPKVINGIESNAIAVNGFASMKNINSVTIPNSITIIGANAFNQSSVNSLNLGNNVSNIGEYAFHQTKLTDINLPESITKIEKASFADISTIENINLPNNLKTIGSFAFSKTVAKYIEIPKSVTTIEGDAFTSWTNTSTIFIKTRDNVNISFSNSNWNGSAKVVLEDIDDYYVVDSNGAIYANSVSIKVAGLIDLNIPSNINGIAVTSIKTYGFSGHKNIVSVKIPYTVTTIGTYAFNQSSINSLDLGNTVTTIGERAFYQTKLTDINLPESITKIEKASFADISTIENINLPNNLKTIGSFAFSKTVAKHIEIPKSVTNIEGDAFTSWTNTSTIFIKARDNVNIIVSDSNWNGSAKVVFEDIDDYYVIDSNGAVYANNVSIKVTGPIDLNIPSSINGIAVTSIKEKGFSSYKNIASVKIPDTVTTIGTYAFNQSSVNSLDLGNNVTIIGEYAFYQTKLTDINLPESITKIERASFASISTIENIKLPNNLRTISSFTFSGTVAKYIEIPKSVTSIEGNAFTSWTNTSIIFIKARDNINISIIDSNWNGSAKVIFENTDDYYLVDSNGAVYANNVLIKATGPIDLNIPSSINGIAVTSIKENGFSNHKNIISAVIPNTVTIINKNAFYNSKLETIIFGDSLKTIGESSFQQTALTSIAMPDSVIGIDHAAFAGISTLKSIKLSNNLQYISTYAFSTASSLSNIDIPKSVTNIGGNAFINWTASQTINFIDRTDTSGITLGTSWKGAAKIIYN